MQFPILSIAVQWRLITVRSRGTNVCGSSGVELCSLGGLLLLAHHSNRAVPSETFPHINQSTPYDARSAPVESQDAGQDPLALPITFLELLTPSRQSIDERRTETIGRLVALDEDAVGPLEALSERRT